jgi:hypothetical protein
MSDLLIGEVYFVESSFRAQYSSAANVESVTSDIFGD